MTTIQILSSVIGFLATTLVGLIAYIFLSTKKNQEDNFKALMALSADLNKFELKIASEYMTKKEIKEVINDLKEQIAELKK